VILWLLSQYKYILCLALVDFYAGLHEYWGRSDNLAQASGSRLSESIRKPT